MRDNDRPQRKMVAMFLGKHSMFIVDSLLIKSIDVVIQFDIYIYISGYISFMEDSSHSRYILIIISK
jgi:hypothetical protein